MTQDLSFIAGRIFLRHYLTLFPLNHQFWMVFYRFHVSFAFRLLALMYIGVLIISIYVLFYVASPIVYDLLWSLFGTIADKSLLLGANCISDRPTNILISRSVFLCILSCYSIIQKIVDLKRGVIYFTSCTILCSTRWFRQWTKSNLNVIQRRDYIGSKKS